MRCPELFFSSAPSSHADKREGRSTQTFISVAKRQPLREMIAYLIQDPVVASGRCRDILLAPSHFDRTNKIKQLLCWKSGIRKKLGIRRV